MKIKISRRQQAKKTKIQKKTALSCCMHGWYAHTLTTTSTSGSPTSERIKK